MLHLVNGDVLSRRITASGLLRPFDPALKDTRDPDIVIPWRDVLYEGPVPAGRSPINLANDRARYIAGRGWAPFLEVRQAFSKRDAAIARTGRHDEVVFWFEDDLYDGLQLAQALDRVAVRRPEETPFSWVLLPSRPGGEIDIRAAFDNRVPVPVEAFTDARTFWTAFTAPDPTDLAALVRDRKLSTAILADTAQRVLAEYPAVGSGLSLSERRVLGTLSEGPLTPIEIFREAVDADPRPFLGDLQVWDRLDRFATASTPLIGREDGRQWVSPVLDLLSLVEPDMDAFHAQELGLTEMGRTVMAGERDFLDLGIPARWVGGVEITGTVTWRWDATHGDLVGPSGTD
ncbi:MAG TPA: hypothetical protein VGT61_08125 [Thermomicrobiales bacterium]|jgi:hypothetical protein|nr:hypothetical protein [Thermomicrobiales bacterium]